VAKNAVRNQPADTARRDDYRPIGGVTFIRCIPPSRGGSHWKVSDPRQRDILTIPFRRPVKPVSISGWYVMPKPEYPVIIEPLPQDDGGGFVALVPDLPGCMSDGETAQAALASVMDAVDAWIDEAKVLGRPIPPPSYHLVAAE
jgi:antitoxin HicB